LSGKRPGYVFGGWFTSDVGGEKVVSTTVVADAEDHVLYAQWQRSGEYNIVYVLNGGVNDAGNPSMYGVGDLPCVIADPYRVGYTFLGWTVRYADGSSVTVPMRSYSVPVGSIGDVVLSAHWILSDVEDTVYYVVDYFGNGADGVDDSVAVISQSYVSGSQVVVQGQSSLSKNGYVFLGWATSLGAAEVSYGVGSTFTITKDVALYAVWRAESVSESTYTVTYRPGTHGTFDEQVYSGLSYGENTPTPPSVTGAGEWVFAGWSPTPSATVQSDAVYTAQWTSKTYTVTFVDHDGRVIAEIEVPSGGTVTPPTAPTRSGHTFKNWSHPLTNITSDTVITAEYEQNQPSSTPSSSGSSSSSSSSKTPAKTTPNTAPIDVPETPNDIEPIDDDIPPTTEPLLVWALVNLVLSVVGLILAIIVVLLVCILSRRNNRHVSTGQTQKKNGAQLQSETEHKLKQHRIIWLITALVMGIVGIVVFLLTENMNYTMTLVDKWTIVNAVIFVVEIIAIALIFKHKKTTTTTTTTATATDSNNNR
ncbi:MAG: InlB B-repeat-containing protein, partial [Candidatus Bathyarchaeota archaeon]|nr:InlB B-repeat-containing protein [Candidatus Termiticorpusculum sp.]